MTRTSKSNLRMTALAAALALGAGLFNAPAALAGDHRDGTDRGRYHRVDRNHDRDRDYRRWDRKDYKRYEKAHKRHAPKYRHKRSHGHGHYVVKKDHSVAPVIVGIGLGILTYAILNESRGHSHGY